MKLISKIFVMMLLFFLSAELFCWEKDEHRLLADLVFDSTLSFCGINFNDSLIYLPVKTGIKTINKNIWNENSFGNISSYFSGDDISQSRSQLKGNSILQQLEPLSAAFIEEVWNRIKIKPGDIQSIEVPNQSVVYNYLLYHLIALRFANLSGNEFENEAFRNALIYEAVALSYLSDAFSSGHLLLSNSDFLASLNRLNTQIAHDHYCSEGVYVINSNGDGWQTFGDKLLQWYPASFDHVFEACATSLRELFLVYYSSMGKIGLPGNLDNWAELISQGKSLKELSDSWITSIDGDKYYSEIKMPALLCIPMPISMTWSCRTEEADEYGIYHRKNYPQLKEDKFHDPDLDEINSQFLYSINSMPVWMIPGFLPNDTLASLIKFDPNVASVRYIQNRNFLPSYQGYLLILGGTYVAGKDKNEFGTSLGFGWGFTDNFLLVFIKPTIFASVTHLSGSNKEWLITTDFGVGINMSILGIIKPHIEIGSAWGFQPPYQGYTGNYALGFDSETLPLGFTYAGLTFRLKYQFILFNELLDSPVLEIILH